MTLAGQLDQLLAITSVQDTENIFPEYHEERHPVAIGAFRRVYQKLKLSAFLSLSLIHTHGAKVNVSPTTKNFVSQKKKKKKKDFVRLGGSVHSRQNAKRPLAQDSERELCLSTQVSFLPLVEDKGTHPPAPQPSLTKTLEILERQGRSVQRPIVA